MSEQSTVFARVRHVDGVAIVDIVGEIDGAADGALAQAYAEAALRAPQRILVNFAGVDYINSTGIAVFVAMLARARRDAIPLAAFGLTDHYHEVFRITRLADFVYIFKDEAAAIGDR